MRRLALLLALACAACTGTPKDVTLAGYTFTLPSNFSAEADRGTGHQSVAFDAFSFDGSCMVQVFSVPVPPADLVEQMKTSFKGTQARPATFTTRFGTLQGLAFQGALPSDTALGTIAQLAGTPSLETYAGKDGEATVGLLMMTLGDARERAAARKTCAAILGSMRHASPPASGR